MIDVRIFCSQVGDLKQSVLVADLFLFFISHLKLSGEVNIKKRLVPLFAGSDYTYTSPLNI